MHLIRILATAAAMATILTLTPAALAIDMSDPPAALHLVRGGGRGHFGGFHGGGFRGGFAQGGGGFRYFPRYERGFGVYPIPIAPGLMADVSTKGVTLVTLRVDRSFVHVMAGLEPAISLNGTQAPAHVDGWVKPSHDVEQSSTQRAIHLETCRHFDSADLRRCVANRMRID